MNKYLGCLRLFSLYNIFYSVHFLFYSDVLLTSQGFLLKSQFNLEPENEHVFALAVLLFRLVGAVFCFVKPGSQLAWVVFFISNSVLYYFAPVLSMAFISIFHCSILILFVNFGISIRSRELVEAGFRYGLVCLMLLHFSSGVAKLFDFNPAWRDGTALGTILSGTTWLRGWTESFIFFVPSLLLKFLSFVVLGIELISGLVFSKKIGLILCRFYFAIHVGTLIFLSIEEISLMLICHTALIVSLNNLLTSDTIDLLKN